MKMGRVSPRVRYPTAEEPRLKGVNLASLFSLGSPRVMTCVRATPFLLAAALILLASTGCRQTEVITSDRSTAARTVVEESRDREAEIHLTTGDVVEARRITVARDSIRWRQAESGTRQAAPPQCVASIRFTRHGLGTLEGFGLGVVSGLGGGGLTILGLSAADRCEGLAALACVLLGITITGVGILGGTVIGAARGHRDVYRFPESQRETGAACRQKGVSGDPDER